MTLNDDEKETLEELLNEEILSYLKSGYNIEDEYVVYLRNIISKLHLKERYDFNKKYL